MSATKRDEVIMELVGQLRPLLTTYGLEVFHDAALIAETLERAVLNEASERSSAQFMARLRELNPKHAARQDALATPPGASE